jgi:hypothetical protein
MILPSSFRPFSSMLAGEKMKLGAVGNTFTSGEELGASDEAQLLNEKRANGE